MKNECVQAFMDGRLRRFEQELEWPEADMDTILAHECQHGSDMRICAKCAKMDQLIRTCKPIHLTVEEWIRGIDDIQDKLGLADPPKGDK